MHGLVVLDENLRPLRPAILWNDGRTTRRNASEIEREIGLERLIELTGNRALTGFTAPKLLWVRRHEPEIFARIRHVLLPKDYVRLRLTGELATDVTDASGTLLFDVQARRVQHGGARDAGAAERAVSRGARIARACRTYRRRGAGGGGGGRSGRGGDRGGS